MNPRNVDDQPFGELSGPGPTPQLPDQPHPASLPAPSPNAKLTLRRMADLLRYEPQPLAEPVVDAEFDQLSWVGRVAEVFRYNAARLEYSVARSGWLRAYAVLNVRLLLFLLIPLGGVLVLLAAANPAFRHLAEILGFVGAASRSLAMAVIWLVVALVIISLTISAVWALLRARRSARLPPRWTD